MRHEPLSYASMTSEAIRPRSGRSGQPLARAHFAYQGRLRGALRLPSGPPCVVLSVRPRETSREAPRRPRRRTFLHGPASRAETPMPARGGRAFEEHPRPERPEAPRRAPTAARSRQAAGWAAWSPPCGLCRRACAGTPSPAAGAGGVSSTGSPAAPRSRRVRAAPHATPSASPPHARPSCCAAVAGARTRRAPDSPTTSPTRPEKAHGHGGGRVGFYGRWRAGQTCGEAASTDLRGGPAGCGSCEAGVGVILIR
jgi:hypothetical protein